MILATDLDGTFLGGDEAHRRTLYRTIRSMPEAVLVFVTGRGLGSITPLLDDPEVPDPRYIIADVGATVVDGHTLDPVEPVQGPIEEAWPGDERVREAMERFDFLVYQDVPQARRCSYLLEETSIEGDIHAVIEEIRAFADEALGLDVLFSAGLYLDLLPRGVSKGRALLSLLEHTGLDHDRVVVAGDTLNDLSLFECDLKGIVVGGAEEALCTQVHAIGGEAHMAEGVGTAGIMEGLRHWGMLTEEEEEMEEKEKEKRTRTATRPEQEPEHAGGGPEQQLVMVYHRMPFDEYRRKGKTYRRQPKSPNGIIPTLLGFFRKGQKGSWVAWSKQDDRDPEAFEERTPVDEELYPNLGAERIALTPHDVRLFYEVFSKEAFWPVIFSFPSKVRFDQEHWRHYLEINRLFAERTAATAEQGALVWIHDYNLWMVPRYLRDLRPDLTIAFFHHTSFPAADVFNIIPWRREIVDSLLQCDYVGFHIPHYVENFVDAVRTHAPMKVLQRVPCAPRFLTFGCALGADEMTTEIEVDGRNVRLGAHPVGIDIDAIDRILESDETHGLIERIRTEVRDRTAILSIERLDYVKGPLEKLQAFERFLETTPELHGKVVLLTVCTPPAPGMRVYRSTRERVDQAVGRINGRFATLDWTPVRYFYRAIPYEEVVAHYAVSDVAWITPLRDGLNMVAKEYIAANHRAHGSGALVLSEFAGAAAELHGALLTNPYDPDRMAVDLRDALRMPEEERRMRLDSMYDIVHANNIRYWSWEFLASVRGEL